MGVRGGAVLRVGGAVLSTDRATFNTERAFPNAKHAEIKGGLESPYGKEFEKKQNPVVNFVFFPIHEGTEGTKRRPGSAKLS